MALRLATSDILPFDHTLQATALESYLAKLSPSLSSSPSVSPSAASLSETDLAPLREAVEAFRAAADAVGSGDIDLAGVSMAEVVEARAVMLRGASKSTEGEVGPSGGEEWGSAGAGEALNERLAMTERRFLAEEGLPGRQWFRHVLQAPGLYLG